MNDENSGDSPGLMGSAMKQQPTVPEAERAARIAELIGMSPTLFDRSVITDAVGRDAEQTTRWWRAMGLVEVPPDVVGFGEDDKAMATTMGDLLSAEPLAEEQILRLGRLLGSSFSRVADAQMEVLEWLVVSLGGSVKTAEDRAALLEDPQIQQLVKMYEDSVLYIWRRHLYGAMGRWVGADDDQDTQVVGFSDISGFSSISKRMDADELTEVIEQFERSAMDSVSSHDGRVVKFIGDGVMYAMDSIPDAVDVALDLHDRMAELDPPVRLHSGVAGGPVVVIAGDVFGNTVNLASRLADVARKGKVVVPKESADSLADRDDLQVQRVRRVFELKGVGRTQLVSVSRKPPEKKSKSDLKDEEQELSETGTEERQEADEPASGEDRD